MAAQGLIAAAVFKDILRSSVNAIPYRIRDWIRYVPGVAALQRLLINRVIADQPFVHVINAGPAAGLRIDVTLPLDKAVWAGNYEREFSAAVANAVKDGAVCYDVGGYRGYMSGVMALAGAAKVIVFEPLPANQCALRRLCELNPGLPIVLLPMAVGKTDGVGLLKVMADRSMAKLADSSFQAAAIPSSEMEITVRQIDSLINERKIPAPDVIKVDVEGAEFDVLQGARKTLQDFRPTILLEGHSAALEQACRQELSALGYAVRRLDKPTRNGQISHLIARPNS